MSKLSRREKNERKKENKKQSRKSLQEWQEKRDIYQFANELNKDTPKSEQWFLSEFIKQNLSIKLERNIVIDYYIADFVYNKLIFEIDGSIHDTPRQKSRDERKDRYYKKKGYTVIRIKAYCQTSFNEGIKRLKEYLGKEVREKRIHGKIKGKSGRSSCKNESKKVLKNLNRCSICKELGKKLVVIKYKSREFKCCEECKVKHEKAMDTLKKD